MIRSSELAAYVLVAALWIVTPGQDTALTVRNSVSGGRAGGLGSVAGIVAGQQVWIIVSALGVTAVLAASHRLFVALELAGSLYLCYLGARALHTAVVRGRSALVLPAAGSSAIAPGAAIRQGVISNLTNPKAGAFFASLLPHFATSFGGIVLLGLLFSAMTASWLVAYTLLIARVRTIIQKPRFGQVLEAVTGTILVGLGLQLAVESV